MRTTVRGVDKIGRITLPKSYRDKLGIRLGEDVSVTIDGNTISIRKRFEKSYYVSNCMGCIHVGEDAEMCAHCAVTNFSHKEV